MREIWDKIKGKAGVTFEVSEKERHGLVHD